MTGSRRKGARGELEAAKELERLFQKPARRGQQYSGSPDSPDVVFDTRLNIEVKRVQALNLDRALEQSLKDAATDQIPVVMHRKNHTKWKVSLYFDDLIKFADVIKDLSTCS